MNKTILILAGLALIVILFGQNIFHFYKPTQFSLPIPYTTQAPDGNWDNNENCEEASAIMANSYLTGNHADLISPENAKKAIADLVSWEQTNIQHSSNTGIDETARMIRDNFHLRTKIINDYSENDLKNNLLSRHVVILFVIGDRIGNTGFTGPVPYHVLVIRGYNQQGFIANDPGSNDGENKIYTFETLKNAAADWDQSKKSIDPLKKVALIVSR